MCYHPPSIFTNRFAPVKSDGCATFGFLGISLLVCQLSNEVPVVGGGTPAEKSGSPPAFRAYVFGVFSNICVVYLPFMLAF